jgi:hypothetical protein
VDDRPEARREYAQLLRLHERLGTQLRRVRDELDSKDLVQILKRIRSRTGSSPREDIAEMKSAVEEALRALKLATSKAQEALTADIEELEIEGVPTLPPALGRFLAERSRVQGFRYEVMQDEIRGWMICWKEYTPDGGVRGYGQFYERPYAWLDD